MTNPIATVSKDTQGRKQFDWRSKSKEKGNYIKKKGRKIEINKKTKAQLPRIENNRTSSRFCYSNNAK